MIFDKSKDFVIHKFFCSCGLSTHTLEIVMDLAEDNQPTQLSISFYPERCDKSSSLWRRIVRSVKYIFGFQPEPWNDFIIRSGDLEEIRNLIEEIQNAQDSNTETKENLLP